MVVEKLPIETQLTNSSWTTAQRWQFIEATFHLPDYYPRPCPLYPHQIFSIIEGFTSTVEGTRGNDHVAFACIYVTLFVLMSFPFLSEHVIIFSDVFMGRSCNDTFTRKR
jgi:hypothetical protein